MRNYKSCFIEVSTFIISKSFNLIISFVFYFDNNILDFEKNDECINFTMNWFFLYGYMISCR